MAALNPMKRPILERNPLELSTSSFIGWLFVVRITPPRERASSIYIPYPSILKIIHASMRKKTKVAYVLGHIKYPVVSCKI